MDKLEYIPGDLVYFGGEKAKVWLRNPSADDSIYVRVIENGGENRIWDASLKEEISPIPLTPEILEKNGWKIEDVNPNDFSNIVSKGIMYRAIKNKEMLFFQKGASIFTCPLNWRKIEIKYVHELQHFLFGLGINHEMEV
jgi:hypothetical protein